MNFALDIHYTIDKGIASGRIVIIIYLLHSTAYRWFTHHTADLNQRRPAMLH